MLCMRENITWFLILLSSVSVFGTNQIDSLTNALENSSDSLEQVQILNRLSAAYYYNDPSEAKKLAIRGVKMAKAIKNKTQEGRLLNTLGIIYYSMYDLDKSRECFDQSLVLQNEVGDLEGVGKALSNIGLTYYAENDYPKALSYYIQSLKIEDQLKNEEEMITSYSNIALIWYDLKDYEKAEKYFMDALDIAKRLQSKEKIMILFSNLSGNYFSKKEWDRSLIYCDSVLQYATELGNKVGIAKAKNKIAKVYYERKNYDNALTELTIAKNIFKELGLEREYMVSKLDEVKILLKMGEVQSAQSMANEILPTIKRLDDLESLKSIYNTLNEIYSAQGNWEQAHQFQETYIHYKDSLLNQDRIKQIAKMQIQYETEKKEQEIEALAQQTMIQSLELKESSLNLIILAIAIVVLLLAGVVFYLVTRQKQLRLQQRAQEIEQNLLRVQMNPHFTFNAMAAIQAYMNQGNVKQAGIYLTKFSKMIRQVLNNSRSEFVHLDQEINMLDNYLALQNLIRENPFDFTIEVEEGIESEEIAIPPMFAQPFVENAIEHGIGSNTVNGVIRIYLSLKNDYLVLSISDNGGMDKSLKVRREGHVSHAQEITKERINLYKQMTKKKIAFNVKELTPGLQVTFQLPYRYV